MMTKKAIILAAGYGTRLRPFTCAVPKPLLPLWGREMIAAVVDSLRERGVEQIAVNAHYLKEQVRAWAEKNNIKVVEETEIMGTGGVLNGLRDWIGNDDFYLVSRRYEGPGFEGVLSYRELNPLDGENEQTRLQLSTYSLYFTDPSNPYWICTPCTVSGYESFLIFTVSN